MRRFNVTITGPDPLGLRDLCDRFVNEHWVADHMTPVQAAASVLEEFKRAVRGKLGALKVTELPGRGM